MNPNGNHLSAGDIPLPCVYIGSAVVYAIAAIYWVYLLISRKNTRVFKAHWLMLLLVLCIVINKILQSVSTNQYEFSLELNVFYQVKYYYMSLGLLSESWKIGFYVFAGIKGILSLLIIGKQKETLKEGGTHVFCIPVLLASGWMFIKPFLSPKDKKVISVIIPLQVLANIVSAISSETTVSSQSLAFWIMILPLFDLISCGIILYTILQTKKHLASAISVDGKGKRSIL